MQPLLQSALPLFHIRPYALLYFNNQLPSGRLLAEKFKATFGEDQFERLISGYLTQKSDFYSYAKGVAGEAVSGFFAQWKQG